MHTHPANAAVSEAKPSGASNEPSENAAVGEAKPGGASNEPSENAAVSEAKPSGASSEMEEKMRLLDLLYQEMIRYYAGDAKRIQHFVKVHSFAELIGRMEGLDADTLEILEAAAYVHDIGIKPAEEKYGKCSGKLQEELGPKPAAELLKKCGFSDFLTERTAYLVGHHHTYENIDGADYQILVEADFLVNLFEDNSPAEAIKNAYKNIFRTKSGREICRTMFGMEEE